MNMSAKNLLYFVEMLEAGIQTRKNLIRNTSSWAEKVPGEQAKNSARKAYVEKWEPIAQSLRTFLQDYEGDITLSKGEAHV